MAAGTTLYVSGSGNDSGSCSTPATACATITFAETNAPSSGGTIEVSGTIHDNPEISKSLTVEQEPGGQSAVLDTGINTYGTLMYVPSGVTATFDQLTFTGGDGDEGAIANSGNLTFIDSTITGNSATQSGGAINNDVGTLTIVDSTIAGNRSGDPGGGGIANDGTATVIDSTISGNTAPSGEGGAINNSGGTITLAGDILATPGGPPTGGECSGAGIVDDGYNVDDDGTCGLSATGSVSDSPSIDDYLGALADNGGTTSTIALLPGTSTLPNPAQAAIPGSFLPPGESTAACAQSDQRGVARAATCDVGSYALDVGQAPPITSGNSTTFTVGAAGSFTVKAPGSPVPAFTEQGGLPAGVTLIDNGNGTATLSGTPGSGMGGVYNITFDASNGLSPNSSQSFTLTVDQAPAITSNASTTFGIGVADSFTVTTTGFPDGSNLTLNDGGAALPSGVSFVDNGDGTATLSGTPAGGSGGLYQFTITASNGVSPDSSQAFSLAVNQAPLITSSGSTTFTAGTAATFKVTTTGYPSGPTLTLTDNNAALPSGVNFLDNGDGTASLSGTPAGGTGGVYDFTITASNGVSPEATQAFALTVDQAPAITSNATAAFTTGTASSFQVTTTGFPSGPILTLSDGGAVLPSGVSFVDNGDGTATLSGTPALGTSGIYGFTLTASNGVSPVATQGFTLIIGEAPAIMSPPRATFVAGSHGTFTFTTTGFPSGPILTLSDGGAVLPSGVSFVDNGDGTATLSGTPVVGSGGTYPFLVTASNGHLPNAVQHFTLTVDQAPEITSAATAMFIAGSPSAFTVVTTGFPVDSISEVGALPAGVSFVDNGTGSATLSGTAEFGSGGIYPLVILASSGTISDDAQSFTLVVNQAPTITSAANTTLTAGVVGTFKVTAIGFPSGPTLTLSDGGALLPSGVTFVDNGNGTATISGTPAIGTCGNYTFTITGSNGTAPTATQSFKLTVDQSPVITSQASATLRVDVHGAFTITTSGFPSAAIQEAGSLPPGVSFANNGHGTATLSGTPTGKSNGTYPLVLLASNGTSTATQRFALTVLPASVPPHAGCSSSGTASPDFGHGYWLAQANGAVYSCGDAPFYGSLVSLGVTPTAPIVGIAPTLNGKGYWLVAKDGGIFAFGNATFFGSMGGHLLNEPVVGMAVTAQGGYYEVASDGGIFSFGPGATFFGSMGGHVLNEPVVGMAVTAQGGYYEVASDGGIFSFGPGATFFGSMGGRPLNAPVVGMNESSQSGYYELASDGGIFTFGSAPFAGSIGQDWITDIVAMAVFT
jgi:hypothetical protein